MAQIPELTVPEVQPRATPAPEARLNVPAEAFSGNAVGQELKGQAAGLNQGAEATFAYAKAFQDLNNKAASDTANSQYSQAARKMTTDWQISNPGAKGLTPGPDGTAPVDTLAQQLTDLRTSVGKQNNLSPIATAFYDQDSRRYQSLLYGNAYDYAKQQNLEFMKTASRSRVEDFGNQIAEVVAKDPTNLGGVKDLLGKMDQEVLHLGMLTGDDQDPATMHLNVLNAGSKALSTIVSGMSGANAENAATLLKQYKAQGWISPEDDSKLTRDLREPLTQQIAAEAAQGSVSLGVTDADHTLNAIMQAESGGKNIINYKEARGEKGFTASGYFQITNPTWERYAPPDVTAKYPRAIDAPFDVQQQVAHTILANEGTTPWKESQGMWGKAAAATGGSPIANLEANLPAVQASASATAAVKAAQFPEFVNPAEVESTVAGHVQQQYERVRYTYAQQQSSAIDTLTSQQDPTTKEPISDFQTLMKIPGMQDQFNALDQAGKNHVLAQIRINSNAYSPSRDTNYRTALGEWAQDPNTFVNTDYGSQDLTRANYTDIIRRQMTTRAEMQRGGATDEFKNLAAALSTPVIKLSLPTDTNDQKQYIGALTTKVEDWMRGNPGKRPSLTDYNAMAQELSTSVGGWGPLGGHPAYKDLGTARAAVPDTFRQQALVAAHRAGLPEPSEAQLESAFTNLNARPAR